MASIAVQSGAPSLDDLRRYSVNRQGQVEAVRQTLYDFQTYPASGLSGNGGARFSFFDTLPSQRPNGRRDTNTEVASVLPVPKNFLIESIEFFVLPTASVHEPDGELDLGAVMDVAAIRSAPALVQLNIGSKIYLSEGGSLTRFPPKTRLGISGAMGGVASAQSAPLQAWAAALNADAEGRPYFISPNLLLISQQNFELSVDFGTPVATPSGEDVRIGVVLDGILYRESQ